MGAFAWPDLELRRRLLVAEMKAGAVAEVER